MNVEDINPTGSSWDGLWTLFAGYFHQDFDLEHDDWQSAVHDFWLGSSPVKITRTIDQIEALLGALTGEDELKRAIEKLGLGFYPDIRHLTYREWLTEIATMLRSYH